jgi:hypothetical protein
MTKSVWYSYVVGAEAVGALEDLAAGGGDHGGLTIIGHGVAITDLIMGLTIARGDTGLDRDGGDMVLLGEDRTGEIRIGEVITTMCRIRPMVLILGTATDTRTQ